MDFKIEREAYLRGYRITSDGILLNPYGGVVNGSVNKCYLATSLRCGHQNLKLYFHRLQAYQKYGDALFGVGVCVRHRNGNPLDNSEENILIGSQSDNMMDMPKFIRVFKAKHAVSFARKYDKESVVNFYHSSGRSYKKTMDAFGITSKGTLHYIIKQP